jgi:membrane protein required for colicin V production
MDGGPLQASRGAGQLAWPAAVDSLWPGYPRAEDLKFDMPITILDFILLGVMLVSALLAMIRGFMREILSIAAWVIAAGATLYGYNKLLPTAKTYFNNDIVAAGVVIGGVFLLTLIIVSIITVRFSDMVLDSRVGALDRTLGFLFGLGRGFLIVVVAFLFFAWLVPPRTQPSWVANAKSRIFLQSAGESLMSMLPEDPENTILKRLKRPKPEEEAPDAPPGQRGSLGNGPREASYGQSDRTGMQRLIQGSTIQGAIAAR